MRRWELYSEGKRKKLMDRIKRIIEECFWDYEISEKDVLEIIQGQDYQKKKFLFGKILLNSTRLFHDLELFGRRDLKKLLDEYKPHAFNRQYAEKRKNLAEVHFFNKPLIIEELKWRS